MRNLLYFLTMILNISGVVFCVSLIFILKSAFVIYLPLILLSMVIFAFSFAVTFLDYNRRNKNKYVIQKPYITDYRQYFAQRRNEFII